MSPRTQLSSQLFSNINNAAYVYIAHIPINIYTHLCTCSLKAAIHAIPRPCHAHKVDTSPAIRRRFINIKPKKSAIPRR